MSLLFAFNSNINDDIYEKAYLLKAREQDGGTCAKLYQFNCIALENFFYWSTKAKIVKDLSSIELFNISPRTCLKAQNGLLRRLIAFAETANLNYFNEALLSSKDSIIKSQKQNKVMESPNIDLPVYSYDIELARTMKIKCKLVYSKQKECGHALLHLGNVKTKVWPLADSTEVFSRQGSILKKGRSISEKPTEIPVPERDDSSFLPQYQWDLRFYHTIAASEHIPKVGKPLSSTILLDQQFEIWKSESHLIATLDMESLKETTYKRNHQLTSPQISLVDCKSDELLSHSEKLPLKFHLKLQNLNMEIKSIPEPKNYRVSLFGTSEDLKTNAVLQCVPVSLNPFIYPVFDYISKCEKVYMALKAMQRGMAPRMNIPFIFSISRVKEVLTNQTMRLIDSTATKLAHTLPKVDYRMDRKEHDAELSGQTDEEDGIAFPKDSTVLPPMSLDQIVKHFIDIRKESSKTVNKKAVTTDTPKEPTEYINGIATSILWDLRRKSVISRTCNRLLNEMPMESLRHLVLHVFEKFRRLSTGKKKPSAEKLQEAAHNFRQVLWLHTLKLLLEANTMGYIMQTTKCILGNAKYMMILKSFQPKLLKLIETAIDERLHVSQDNSDNCNSTSNFTDTIVNPIVKNAFDHLDIPSKIICSDGVLEETRLLSQLSEKYQIDLVERDLQHPIQFVLDQQTGLSIISSKSILDESYVKEYSYSLAKNQFQIWILVDYSTEVAISGRCVSEEHKKDRSGNLPPFSTGNRALQAFYCAMGALPTKTHLLFSFHNDELCSLIRHTIDSSSITATARGEMPVEWFERPFLMCDESQHERFLVSTRILNPLGAQYLLYKLPLLDWIRMSFEEYKELSLSGVTRQQLLALHQFLQQNHTLFESSHFLDKK